MLCFVFRHSALPVRITCVLFSRSPLIIRIAVISNDTIRASVTSYLTKPDNLKIPLTINESLLILMEIDASTTVGTILRDYPELTDWFMDMGLCGCGHDSSMMWTMERLAKEKSLGLAPLLDDINERIAWEAPD